VVEDDDALRAATVEALRDEGYRVTAAANGLLALDAIERESPSLVLLDMRMPELNGWDFARALRDSGIETPIVVMTAAQDAQRWARDIAAADYLAKPFELPDLLAAVERWSGRP
jgi:two-component system, OmpR family, response regulator MprA